MKISINDLLNILVEEARHSYEYPTEPAQEYPDEVGETEVPAFDNNEDAIRRLFKKSITSEDYLIAYRIIELANELKITLIEKA